MKKKWLALFTTFCSFTAVAGLSACSTDSKLFSAIEIPNIPPIIVDSNWVDSSVSVETHTHTFDIAMRNDTHHWKECPCGERDTLVAHTFNIAKMNDTHHWKECPCGENDAFVAHTYVNNKCSCGAEENTTKGLAYALSTDKSYYIVGRGTATDINIIIPATYNNLPVKEIGTAAFDGCSSLISVTIPDSVTSIKERAFYNCSNLTSVALPDSVTNVGESAFYGCDNLIEKENGVFYVNKWVVGCDKSIIDVTLRANTKGIVDSAFYNCDSLTNITIPDSVKSIGNYAFRECSGLTSVTIPNSVIFIGGRAFYNCSSLTSVAFENTNGWKVNGANVSANNLANATTAAEYLKSTYSYYTWIRS